MCQSDAAVVNVDGVCTALSWRRGDRSRQRRDLAVGRVVEDKHVHHERAPYQLVWKRLPSDHIGNLIRVDPLNEALRSILHVRQCPVPM